MTAPPASSQPSVPEGVRASDSERDEAVGELGEHYAAGRLSHRTFMHRVDAVMGARRREDLRPLLADLPPRERPRGGLAARWSAFRDEIRDEAGALARSVVGGLGLRTGGFPAVPPERVRLPLSFPRGSGMSFIIGRDRECDLTLEDPTVSRFHAILKRDDGGWLLSDSGSTNGTRVNGWRVRGSVPVCPGDVVRFGESEYTLEPSDE